MPLQGLWWMENMADFSAERKGDWEWTMMILQPPPVTEDKGFFSSLAFWRDRPDYINFSGTFMTSLRPDGADTRVYLLFGTGEPVDTQGTEHILGIFMDRLG